MVPYIHNSFCLIIIPLLINFIHASSLTHQPIIKLKTQGGYNAHMFFPGINLNYSLLITLSNQTTWLSPLYSIDYDEILLASKAIHSNNVTMTYRGRNYTGNEIESNVYFANDNKDDKDIILLNNFNIQLYENISSSKLRGYKGMLALGFDIADERYSLIHQYRHKGLIDSLSFSFARENYAIKLYLGGIPDNITTASEYHSYFNVIGLNNHWDCYMSKVTIDNTDGSYDYDLNNTEYSGYMYFDTVDSYIYAPPNFLQDLSQTYLKEAMDSKTCSYIHINSIRQYTCYYENSYLKGSLTFVIEDYVYTYNLSSLWSCDLDFCDFIIAENPYGDYWILGTSFLINFDVLFDYDNKKVHLYSNRKIVKLYVQPFKMKGILYVINITILLFGLALSVYLFNKRSKLG